MSLDKELINKLVKVTSRAAINCYQFLGKGNKKIADKAATDSMRNDLNNLEINGEVVIGEGELDKAPMLYIGEKLGKGNGPNLDIAVDPLEGTNFAAKNIPGAITLGFVQQITRAFGRVENSLQYLVRSWSTIVELISVWKRLSEFEARLKYNSEESTVENI